MAARPDYPPVIAIVGETASGKTSLAIKLAQELNGEIIAADSRTVYKGMDIGTAKPTPEEQRLVPHHLIDVASPDEYFTAARFKQLAEEAINDIASRGKLPFLVGGSGLYVDAVMYDFSFRPPADPLLRKDLQAKTTEELQAILKVKGIALPNNPRNPRHLIRAIETEGHQPARSQLRKNGLMLRLKVDSEVLKQNISRRVDLMLQAGLINEVRMLAEKYSWDAPGMQSPGYATFRPYLEGQITFTDARKQVIQAHSRLAKRQRTWFNKNPDIHYICKKEEAVDVITTFLNNNYTAS